MHANKTYSWVKANKIKLDLLPTYPMCYTVDLKDYFSSFTPLQIFFNFKKLTNFSINFMIEERNKKMTRALKFLLENYSGPTIRFENLETTEIKKVLLTLSQTIRTEKDRKKPCVDYPTKQYSSYGECDRSYIFEKVWQDYGLIPFWTAKSWDNVTKLKYFYLTLTSSYTYIFRFVPKREL